MSCLTKSTSCWLDLLEKFLLQFFVCTLLSSGMFVFFHSAFLSCVTDGAVFKVWNLYYFYFIFRPFITGRIPDMCFISNKSFRGLSYREHVFLLTLTCYCSAALLQPLFFPPFKKKNTGWSKKFHIFVFWEQLVFNLVLIFLDTEKFSYLFVITQKSMCRPSGSLIFAHEKKTSCNYISMYGEPQGSLSGKANHEVDQGCFVFSTRKSSRPQNPTAI